MVDKTPADPEIVDLAARRAHKAGEELIAAAYWGDLASVRQALDRGADVNFKDPNGVTALYWVCDMGIVGLDRDAIAQVLIDAGADVNVPTAHYRLSMLSTACDAGNLKIVKLLVEHGAQINDDSDGSTPLICAILSGDQEMVDYLLRHGADPKKRDASGKLPVELAIQAERFEIADLLRKL